jgi:hexokinase
VKSLRNFTFRLVRSPSALVCAGPRLASRERCAAHLAVIRDSISREMDRGLQRTPSKIRMLSSFVDKLPTGAEAGGVLALDLGGTNYRSASHNF